MPVVEELEIAGKDTNSCACGKNRGHDITTLVTHWLMVMSLLCMWEE